MVGVSAALEEELNEIKLWGAGEAKRDALHFSKLRHFSDELLGEVIKCLGTRELCSFAETCKSVNRNSAF